MTSFGRSDHLQGSTFRQVNLTGARFVACDLGSVVMRAVDVSGMEIDAPWLFDNDEPLLVNGVDVKPLVEASLNHRFPGRELRRAETPEGLQQAWVAVQAAWSSTIAWSLTLPAGTVNASVGGEWSVAETLRHLVLATDVWLGRAVLGQPNPFHPLGLLDSGSAASGLGFSPAEAEPSWPEIVAAREDRVAQVTSFLAAVSPSDLGQQRPNPHAPQYSETVLSCLHTILDEEWEHHRYAVRDLTSLADLAQ